MIKLIATDIDGTILIPEKTFTQEVKNCINSLNKRGIKVVVVTGRMNSAAELIAQELGLKTPIVSYQGGLITFNEKVLYEKYLTEAQAQKVIKWGKQEDIHLNLYNNDILYSETDCYEVQRYCNNLHTRYVVEKFENIKKTKVNKLLAIDYNNPERINTLEKLMQKEFPDIYIVKSTPYFLEFSNKEASKYCAVKFLQKYWNLKSEEILTIGDQNNDIELLRAGGIKVAMGNATDDLKSIADYVTDTVENNGFVKAVEMLL
ncbi:MAG: Cof-type HAD-IIB family hydrolase [bacterium]|nr:Cof-type HAD-IIB family hydrolase [bacterium]